MKEWDENHLHVSWQDYHRKTEELAIQVSDSGWDFNQVVCIAKGGLRVGDVFARIFDLPLAILSVESYKGTGTKNQQGAITFSRDLAKTTPNLGSRVLLVDDLVDTGVTLEKTIAWLNHFYGFYLDEVRTAVIWQKATSTFKPDYKIDYLDTSPWIHMPFEKYEEMDITQLTKDHLLTKQIGE